MNYNLFCAIFVFVGVGFVQAFFWLLIKFIKHLFPLLSFWGMCLVLWILLGIVFLFLKMMDKKEG